MMTGNYNITLSKEQFIHHSDIIDFWHLLKPRVMSLVVFSAASGLLIAPGNIHPIMAIVAIMAIAVGAGAAGAINMWYDRDIDAIMQRTAHRPIPQGKISPHDALTFGIFLSAGSVMILGLAINWLAAFLLAFAIFFYSVVYTCWLKRYTIHNIVIGGAAGAFPPMIGWVAVTGQIDTMAWVLFALIFFWTPPHFWALALVKNDDYKIANIPMLPVIKGHHKTCQQIVVYSISLLPLSLMPVWLGYSQWLYGIVATILSLIFIAQSIKLYVSHTNRDAMRLFGFSIIYLFAIFTALVGDYYVR